MDIGRAFSFVFEDSEWVKKVLLGGLISLIPIVGGFVVYGYMLEIVKRIATGSEEELPEWDDFGGYLTRGFLFAVGLFIWFLPVIVLISCVAIGIAMLGGASGNDAIAALTGILVFGLFGILFLVLILFAAVALPIVGGRYAMEQRFGTMFEFELIFRQVRQTGAAPLLLFVLTALVANFVGSLGFVLCFVGIIFTSFYAYVVTAHAAGQVYRKAGGNEDISANTLSLEP